jgi:hypothetical protein
LAGSIRKKNRAIGAGCTNEYVTLLFGWISSGVICGAVAEALGAGCSFFKSVLKTGIELLPILLGKSEE